MFIAAFLEKSWQKEVGNA